MIALTSVIMTFVVLAGLVVLVRKVLNRFGVGSFFILFGVGHFLFIALMAVCYYTMPSDAQQQLFWISVDRIDTPISFLVQNLAPNNMRAYIALLAILGSFQYAVIGWCIDLRLAKDKKALVPTKRVLIIIAVIFCFLAFLAYRNITFNNLNEYEKTIIQLKDTNDEEDRFGLLRKAAKASFKSQRYSEARSFAEEVLTLSQKHKDAVVYGGAIYDANIILGRLSLRDGNSEQAIYYLMEAAETPGDAGLASFGPDMSLAKELLEKGYRKPVVEFLIACKRFWTFDDGKLDKWIKEINDGKMPDFGTHLD